MAVIDRDPWVAFTDMTGNRVVLIHLNTGASREFPVGEAPLGIAYDQSGNRLFVVNHGDKSVSKINLDDGIVATLPNVGIAPTKIALYPPTHQGIVLDAGANAVIFIDLDF